MAGLRCVQPHIRAKFFHVFDASMRKRLHDRLLYVVCSQNWESMGPHYWIKQIVELMMATADQVSPITNCTPPSHLPSITAVIAAAEPSERNAFNSLLTSIKEEPTDIYMAGPGHGVGDGVVVDPGAMELAEMTAELAGTVATAVGGGVKRELGHCGDGVPQSAAVSLNHLIASQFKFLESAKDYKTADFLNAMSQLAHMNHTLAEDVWLNFFPRVWRILSDKQRETVGAEIVPFICSGTHCKHISTLTKLSFHVTLHCHFSAILSCEMTVPREMTLSTMT